MSFISYAQNFEDVMLWRALKHVENGFYIDVGANDPTFDSVTRAFYERGWNGINIEPLPSHHVDLLRDRPRDINLQCAVGDDTGEIEIWECNVRGWATASVDVITQHMESGHVGIFHKVPVVTLADICARNVKDEIHFLKIDVEGFEKSVIDGMDFSRFRPWVLVIEATKPNSTVEIHEDWNGNILAVGYSLAYCDGVNRFYVAKEHSELLELLRYPPNVFDEFIRSEQLNSELRAHHAEIKAHHAEIKAHHAETKAQQAETKAQQAEIKAQQAEIKAQQAETKAQQAETKAQQAETKAQQAEVKAQYAEVKAQYAETASLQHRAQLQAVYASRSWRITSPLRWVLTQAKLLRSAGFQSRVKALVKKVLRKGDHLLQRRPALRQRLLRWSHQLGLYGWLKVLHGKAHVPTGSVFIQGDASKPTQTNPENLSIRAQQIYSDLKAAIQPHQKGSN